MAAPRLSYGLLVASIVLTAIVVHPSVAALLAMAVNLGVLVAMRRAAFLEGARHARAALQGVRPS